jgi:plastocyanin
MALTLTGCQNDGYAGSENEDVRFRVIASNSDIVAGDVVTFTTRSENTLGRDAKVTWTSTGGEIDTEDGGRIARATFEKPGTYTVTGQLKVDGQVVRSDSVDVRVKAVR